MPQLAAADLVFVDETGVATDLARRYGRAQGGRRAASAVPDGAWHRLTILGALSLAGRAACMAVDSATDTDVFVAFVRHVLVPALRPGQVVILDNLSPHKAAVVRQLIEGAGCRLLFLLPYAPDLNPIDRRGAISKRCCVARARAPSPRCTPRSKPSSTRSPRAMPAVSSATTATPAELTHRPLYRGGEYGADVNFPVPTDERVNDKFGSCTNRTA